ncbi:STAS/SEC14 domain-containing protein [Corallococcus llansteffanensis]|uniref:STAS/SEC14 domain-containing protein n=1 Tax=Corallococcus llansteffanensis TaxID=2316731 RepID=A0A3A8MWF6_9BACT|nr:STAS/SEC14 domain-containing protein [Corallococcus llansteffanensis]RKH36396.1 STAS/SEC14 domain-containing protein [Corallococcus llansteffanensis]
MGALREWVFGAQRIVLESPDIVWATVRGAFGEEEVRQLMGVFHELTLDPGGPFYLVVDLGSVMGPMTEGPALSVAPRKYLAGNVRPEWFRAVIFYGGNRTQRDVMKALVVALQFTGDTKLEARFLETSGEARAWLAAHRQRQPLPPASPIT